MRALKHSLAAAAVSILSLTVLPPAIAQNDTPGPAKEQAPSPSISDRQLDQTAAAMQQVSKVRRSYQPQLQSAEPDQQKRILEEANSAMVKAVTDQGLSVDEYNSIVQVARNDPEIRDKLLSRIDQSGKE